MNSLLPTYGPRTIEIAQASGSYVTDVSGKTYLDFVMGIAVCGTGHRHPYVQQKIEDQLNRVWHTSNLYLISGQQRVAEKLTNGTHLTHAFFCNSGTEANEAAFKLVRKWTQKTKIITFTQSFHGRTFAMLGATGQEKVKHGFGPMVSDFIHAPFNDMNALDWIDDETSAIWLEIVQGEGGVVVAEASWLRALQEAADKHDVKIVVDEVQTGIARTGTRFAYEQTPLRPHVVTLAKGLGSGIPVGAILTTPEAATVFGPGSHGSTFGGNPVAMAAAEATLDVLLTPESLKHVTDMGDYLKGGLSRFVDGERFVEVRGLGLMIGLVSTEPVADWVTELAEVGLLVVMAGPHVIRFLPSLLVTKSEIDEALTKLEQILQKEGVV
ncbi:MULTISPECIES: acetylornithine transaminase [unclassified Exiguobacterium]|uniref:Acetylornithine aminotransferase n=1 Tax=Exiguobacterium sp. (strain ATCC BAA-1283 / AT1b) TaxID=360911 RepID=C4L127_EXISA|nr:MULTISPECIES: acetylornithine transaminase [unclassified Exiguobacterium]ACQ70990.1 acetylornithine and succinylornithine aminotransferase [Exiguobacterium sp. AT1b]